MLSTDLSFQKKGFAKNQSEFCVIVSSVNNCNNDDDDADGSDHLTTILNENNSETDNNGKINL